MAFFSLPFFTVKITEGAVSSFKAREECRSQKCNFPLGLMSCSLTDSVIFLLLLCLQVKPQPMRIAGIHTFLMVDVLGMNQRHVCGVPCSKSTLSKMFVGDFTDKKLEKKNHENFSFLPHSAVLIVYDVEHADCLAEDQTMAGCYSFSRMLSQFWYCADGSFT